MYRDGSIPVSAAPATPSGASWVATWKPAVSPAAGSSFTRIVGTAFGMKSHNTRSQVRDPDDDDGSCGGADIASQEKCLAKALHSYTEGADLARSQQRAERGVCGLSNLGNTWCVSRSRAAHSLASCLCARAFFYLYCICYMHDPPAPPYVWRTQSSPCFLFLCYAPAAAL